MNLNLFKKYTQNHHAKKHYQKKKILKFSLLEEELVRKATGDLRNLIFISKCDSWILNNPVFWQENDKMRIISKFLMLNNFQNKNVMLQNCSYHQAALIIIIIMQQKQTYQWWVWNRQCTVWKKVHQSIQHNKACRPWKIRIKKIHSGNV